jgi:hypothetical protein
MLPWFNWLSAGAVSLDEAPPVLIIGSCKLWLSLPLDGGPQ